MRSIGKYSQSFNVAAMSSDVSKTGVGFCQMCKSPAANGCYLEIVLRLRLWSALDLLFRYSVDLAENAINNIMNTHDEDMTIHHVFF